jgi:hypothetical protein
MLTSMRVLRRRWRRFREAGTEKQYLLFEAAVVLAASRLAVAVLPFAYLSRHWLGTATSPAEAHAGLRVTRAAAAASRHALVITRIGWAVRCAARQVPFRAVCLPQAIAAKYMLRRRGIASSLYFGVRKDAAGTWALHAWLWAETIEVTGYPLAHDVTPIACYL